MRILIIDDNEGAAHALQRCLRLEPWTVERASTGAEGEVRLREPWDVIFMDYDLGPGQPNGVQLTQYRWQCEESQALEPATILTYSGGLSTNDEMMAAGANVKVGKMASNSQILRLCKSLEETKSDHPGETRGECGERERD